MAISPEGMLSAVSESLATRTGRSLEEWLEAVGSLQPSNGPGQATHKVALSSTGDADDEVRGLLRTAYEQNP